MLRNYGYEKKNTFINDLARFVLDTGFSGQLLLQNPAFNEEGKLGDWSDYITVTSEVKDYGMQNEYGVYDHGLRDLINGGDCIGWS